MMNRDEFFNKIKQSYELTPIMIKQFDLFKNFLQEQNEIHNLTNLADNKVIYEKYFYDSILPYQGFNFAHLNVLDIGSGSGIPGVIIKILFPNCKLTIIEANIKKINFLKSLISLLGLKDIEILKQRAEEINDKQRALYDVVTSRAVAKLKILIEISTPYLKLNGILIEPKSINYQNEYNEAIDLIDEIGLQLLKIEEFNSSNQHYVFYFKKIKNTSLKFPRKWKDII